MKKNAFTLIELLLGLVIVGVIAALTIPNVMDYLNRRILASQVKDNITEMYTLITEQLTDNKTTDLTVTAFANPASLITHFDVSPQAPASWPAYRTLEGEEASVTPGGSTVLLKNGTMLSYSYDGDNKIGTFTIDTNGIEAPNIAGRDLFQYDINLQTRKITVPDESQDTALSNCRSGTSQSCLTYLMLNDWKMDY